MILQDTKEHKSAIEIEVFLFERGFNPYVLNQSIANFTALSAKEKGRAYLRYIKSILTGNAKWTRPTI